MDIEDIHIEVDKNDAAGPERLFGVFMPKSRSNVTSSQKLEKAKSKKEVEREEEGQSTKTTRMRKENNIVARAATRLFTKPSPPPASILQDVCTNCLSIGEREIELRSRLEEQKATNRKELTALRRRYDEAVDLIRHLERILENSENEVKKECNAYRTEVTALKTSLERSDTNAAATGMKLRRSVEENERLREYLNEMAAKYDDAVQENRTLKIGYENSRAMTAMPEGGDEARIQTDHAILRGESTLLPSSDPLDEGGAAELSEVKAAAKQRALEDGVAFEAAIECAEAEIRDLQEFSIEIAHESDVALHAAVEEASQEICMLQTELNAVKRERNELRKYLYYTKAANESNCRKDLDNLKKVADFLSESLTTLGDVLNGGMQLRQYVDGQDILRSELISHINHKQNCIRDALQLQIPAAATTQRLSQVIAEMYRRSSKPEHLFVEMLMAELDARNIKLRCAGLSQLNPSMDVREMSALLGDVLYMLHEEIDTLHSSAPEILRLRDQLDASDFTLEAALRQQAEKFNGIKADLQNQAVKAMKESQEEARAYEDLVAQLESELRELKATLRQEGRDTSSTSPIPDVPESEENHATIELLKEELDKERIARRMEWKRNILITEDRARVIMELSVTIARLQKEKEDSHRIWKRARELEHESVQQKMALEEETKNAEVAARAIEKVEKEFLNVRSELELIKSLVIDDEALPDTITPPPPPPEPETQLSPAA